MAEDANELGSPASCRVADETTGRRLTR